jgi:hypothetical protein
MGVVESCTTDNQIKLSLRKSKKNAKNAFRAALPGNILTIYATVLTHFGPTSPEMDEIFVSGRGVFGDCADDHLENHLQTTLAGLTAHVAVLGAPVVADATGLLTSWLAIYGASESSTGAATTTQGGKAAARLALQLDLFKNLLTVALNFPTDPSTLTMYMTQSFLEDHPAGPLPGQPTIDAAVAIPGAGYHLDFSLAEGADSFEVWGKAPGAADFALIADGITDAVYEATGQALGDWQFQVYARNANGRGPASEVATVTVA